MSQAEHNRFSGPCSVLFIGVAPITRRDLVPLLARHLPLTSALDLPKRPSAHDLAAGFKNDKLKFCFAEVARADDPVLDLIPELLRLDSKASIVAVVPAGEPDLLLRCLRLGANAFLTVPLSAEQVQETVQKLFRGLPQGPPRSEGKVFSVISAKGACGATTIACALTYQWKRCGMSRVLLADLDPLTGLVAFLLKLKPQYSFLDVLRRSSEMDADLWKAMVVSQNGVDVLAAPESLSDADVELIDASPILGYARHNYDVTIADAGRAFGEWTLSQAALSDEILLVTTNELFALQSAQKVVKYLEANQVGKWKIRLIVNRYDARVGLSEDLISNALQMEISQVLPSDYETVQKALLEGKQISPSSRLGKSMTAFADKLAGRKEQARRPASLAGLLSLFSRTSS